MRADYRSRDSLACLNLCLRVCNEEPRPSTTRLFGSILPLATLAAFDVRVDRCMIIFFVCVFSRRCR